MDLPVLVSVIIPCYNVEDYISECLDSAVRQIYRPIEIIAIDNNSTDDTFRILKKYEENHPSLIKVYKEGKQGAPASRNKGISVAKGEWLQFLDADDLILPGKILSNVKLIEAYNKTSMVVSGHIYRKVSGKENVYQALEGDLFQSLVWSNLGYTVSNLFKNYNNKVKIGWNEDLYGAQDMDFIFQYIRMFGKEGIAYDKNILTITRQRKSGQVTTSNPLLFEKSCFQFQKSVVHYLESEQPEYFSKHRQFFMDTLYYFVYRIGIVNPEEGMNYFKREMEEGFRPVRKPDNRVSWIHEAGVWLFGVRGYFWLRNAIRKLFKI